MSVITTKEELLEFRKDKEYWPEAEAKRLRIDNGALRIGEKILFEHDGLWFGERFTQQVLFEHDALQALPSATKIKAQGGCIWNEASGDFLMTLEEYLKYWREECATKTQRFGKTK
jgi:hypothetical protein